MGIEDAIFPRKCFGCRKEREYLCSYCLNKVRQPSSICPECGGLSLDGKTHLRCKKTLGIDGLISLWTYEGVIRRAIIALKYKFAWDITEELSTKSLEKLKGFYLPKKAIVVPIPAHRIRENWRGFNQAEEIGKIIARGLNFKFCPDFLIKAFLTPPQTGLKGRQRRKNIKNVFKINPRYQFPSLCSFVLFDDVWTTGATIREAARVLKMNKAREVWGLTLARGR